MATKRVSRGPYVGKLFLITLWSILWGYPTWSNDMITSGLPNWTIQNWTKFCYCRKDCECWFLLRIIFCKMSLQIIMLATWFGNYADCQRAGEHATENLAARYFVTRLLLGAILASRITRLIRLPLHHIVVVLFQIPSDNVHCPSCRAQDRSLLKHRALATNLPIKLNFPEADYAADEKYVSRYTLIHHLIPETAYNCWDTVPLCWCMQYGISIWSWNMHVCFQNQFLLQRCWNES